MKKTLQFFLVVFAATTLFACQSNLKEIVEKKFPDGSPEKVNYYKQKKDTLLLVKSILYYPNHYKREEGEYKNNKRHGKWQVWYDNGNLWSEGEYKNGVRNGLARTYYQNGEKRYEGAYKNGTEAGVWKFWSETGELIKTVDFDKK